MERTAFVFFVLLVLAIRHANIVRRELTRLDRKLDLVLKEMEITFDEFPPLSDRVKELARDPSRKIEAIKVYREEAGVGLATAKEAVETFIKSASDNPRESSREGSPSP